MRNYWLHGFHDPTRTRVWGSSVGRLYQETVFVYTITPRALYRDEHFCLFPCVLPGFSFRSCGSEVWVWPSKAFASSLLSLLATGQWLSTLHSEITGLCVHALYQGLAYSVPRSLWWNSPRKPSLHSWQQCRQFELLWGNGIAPVCSNSWLF